MRKPSVFVAAAFLFAQQQAAAGPIAEDSWPSTISVHYRIYSPRPGLPAGFASRLERIHKHLSRELRRINRWMETERILVYLYADRQSYIRGTFRPPPWSGGAAIVSGPNDPKRLALIAGADDKVIAHEMTHLFLNSYFSEQKRRPPRWLNEGLAAMVENDVARKKIRPLIPSALPMEEFLRQVPQRDDAAARVGLWYRQAESVVRFLKQGSGFKFDSFCRALRNDVSAERALFQVYAYSNVAAFEKAWLDWAKRQSR